MKKFDIACLIDDDEIFTYVMSKQMKLIDFCDSILVFKDGDEALRYLKPIVETPETLPSIILLDINMPVIDGWQFLDEFIKFDIKKEIIIYIVSSSIDMMDLKKAASYQEISSFYVKPISKYDLIEMLNTFQA